MLKLLLSILSLSILFGQEPAKNQISFAFNRQFITYSLAYENSFYGLNAFEIGLGTGAKKFDTEENLNIPISYKRYLSKLNLFDIGLGHTFVFNGRSFTHLSFGINSNELTGINFRFGIQFRLQRFHTNSGEMNFIPLENLLLQAGYRF